LLGLAVGALGGSAFCTQLVLMRELLSVLAGNELSLGVTLGNWLLLTGLGSYFGKTASRLRHPAAVLVAAQIAIGVLPLVQVFLLRALRNVVFLRGTEVGVTETVAASFLVLAPYCLVMGYLLTLASLVLAARKDAASIGQVYFLDNVGEIVGGLLFSFVLVYWFDHFQVLYFAATANVVLAGLVALAIGQRSLAAVAGAVLASLVGVLGTIDLDLVSTRMLHRGQEVVWRGHSPYGRLVVTESAGQVSFLENGVLLFSTGNVGDVEETVHLALAQRPQARRVLLMAGGISGTAREILRYGVATVDYVELDPLIIDVGRKYLPESLADARIRVVATDGRRFVRQTPERYDVVIVAVPDPSTSQLNRFYTQEFFRDIAARLTPEGVLCLAVGRYVNYLSDELSQLIAVTHRTLREQFPNVLLLPAGKIFYLASAGPLTADVAGSIEQQGLRNRLVNRHYLKAMLTQDRLEAVNRALSDTAPRNRDFSPILYYCHLRYWMSQFRVRFGVLEGGLLLVLLISLCRARPVSFAVFTAGMAASGLEVVLLMGLQILSGCLYHQVSLLVTMFMIGLGLGSYTMNRSLTQWTRRDLVWLALVMAALAASLPWLLLGLGQIASVAVQAVAAQGVILLLTLVLAGLVGLMFPLAGKIDFRTVSDTAARIYTADYLGAALGALLVSTWLIPMCGVAAVCLGLAVLSLVSGGVVYWTRYDP
jgi:spermidine synthase